jgi:hypothetical protein
MASVLLKLIGPGQYFDVGRPSYGPKPYFNRSAHLDQDAEFQETF